MRFLSRQPRQSKKTRPSTKLQFEGLESRDLPAGYATAALALVPDTAVNAMAVQSSATRKRIQPRLDAER